jgi:hypothetical protein
MINPSLAQESEYGWVQGKAVLSSQWYEWGNKGLIVEQKGSAGLLYESERRAEE